MLIDLVIFQLTSLRLFFPLIPNSGYLARRFGFGSNTKACRHWLETIGISESQWLTEPSLIKAQKLPREILPWLDRQYASRQGTRQGLLGE